jgi:NAD(P)-dependent dehydrogenase (short-subunit alcohol dehydrogenase family)
MNQTEGDGQDEGAVGAESTVVVTGATGGIGTAVAHEFATADDRVVVGSRDADAVAALVEDLSETTAATGVRTDVRDEFDLERLMETASTFGPRGIDVVVAAAGVYHGDPGGTPTDEESYSAFDDHLRTNARGVFATIQEALPHLSADGRVIVPTGSVARDALPGFGSYAISKAAAEGVVRAFAADVDSTVGCVDPGRVATDLAGGEGRDPEAVAPLFRWAAIEAPADDLDGEILELADWRTATA